MSRVVLFSIFVSACSTETMITEGGADEDLAAATAAENVNTLRAGKVPNQYIVVLKDQGLAPTDTATLAASLTPNVRHVFSAALRGFSANLTDEAAAALANDARVLSVEPNKIVVALGTQSNATWGIDRLDQENGTNGKYTYQADGSGVTAYIVDTGIRTTHQDLQGRASLGFSSIADGNGATDCHGHGTHVAGTVGGGVYGVAKAVSLVAVRVLDCQGSGTDETVIQGLEWVAQHATGPSVVNMSLGGEASDALDTVIRNMLAANISVVLAAGNESQDACNVSPARVKEAITVGATNKWDFRGIYSNTGTCVDLFAPGSSITSLDGKRDSGTATMSGTSMASPHVAGAAALYLSKHPTASPEQVRDALVQGASPGQVRWAGSNSPNLLLNISFIQ